MELTRNGLMAYLRQAGYTGRMAEAIFDEMGGLWNFVRKDSHFITKGTKNALSLVHVRDCYHFCENHKNEILHWAAVYLDRNEYNPLSPEHFFALCYNPMHPSEHHKELVNGIVKDLANQVLNAEAFYADFPDP